MREEDIEFFMLNTKIKSGDLIEFKKAGTTLHKLLCGDSRDAEQVKLLMGEEKAELVFTDPDYSMEFEDIWACYLNEKEIIQPKVSFWMCNDKQAVQLASRDFERFAHFFVNDRKTSKYVGPSQPILLHHLICKFGQKKMKNLRDRFTTIIRIAADNAFRANQPIRWSKRVDLPATFIKHYTDENDLVVDIFLHSGSTMVAAHRLKRRCYAMEIEPYYCQFATDRMLAEDGSLEVFVNGEQFSEAKNYTLF